MSNNISNMTSEMTHSTSNNYSVVDSLLFENMDDINNDLYGVGVSNLTITLSLVGILICLIGIIGNFFSIIVLLRKSMKKLSIYSYLLGLSICDEISLTLTVFIFLDYTMPFIGNQMNIKMSQNSVNNYRIFLFYIYPVVASTQALSIWITLAFTVDRYLYVCQPYIGRKFCTRRRALIVIISLYIFASLYSIPQFLDRTYVKEEIYNYEIIFLTHSSLGRNGYFIYIYHLFVYSVFVSIIPFIIIVILNCFIVYDIIKSNKRHRELSLGYRNSLRCSSKDLRSSSSKVLLSSKFLLYTNLKKKASDTSNLDTVATVEPLINSNPKNSIVSNQISISQVTNSDKTLRNDVTILLIGLIIVFLICQAPSTVLRLIMFKNLEIYFKPLYTSSLDVSNFLIVFNSTLNCILYVMLGKRFRKEFLKLFFTSCFKVNAQSNDKTSHF